MKIMVNHHKYPPDEELMAGEVAALLKVTRQMVWNWCQNGLIRFRRDKWGRHLIRAADAYAFTKPSDRVKEKV